MPPARATKRVAGGDRRRQAKLSIAHVGLWSVLRVGVPLAVLWLAIFLALAVGGYATLSASGAVDAVNKLAAMTYSSGHHAPLITAGPVVAVAALLAGGAVILLLAAVTALLVLYDAIAPLTGGFRVTLVETGDVHNP